MQRREVMLGLIAAGTAGLSGCTEVQSIETTEELQNAAMSDETSIVFGRVKWIENGEELDLKGSNFFGKPVVPRLRRVEDNSIVTVELDNAGHFAWSLSKGTYIIDKIQRSSPKFGSAFLIPKVAFRVPENGRNYYIGTLQANAVAESSFWGVEGNAKFSIADEMRSEYAYLRQKLGSSVSDIQRSLMVQDENLPDTFDTTAEFSILTAILGAPW